MNPIHRLFAMLLLALTLAACQSAPKPGLSPEQIAVLKQEGFQQTDEGWELGLSSKVLFGNDMDTIDGDSRVNIERIGRLLQGVGLERLRLDGHTDASGSAEYNQRLSLRRAQAVADVLSGIGLRPENLTVQGFGMTKPVADNSTEAGRMENRRVSIIVLAE